MEASPPARRSIVVDGSNIATEGRSQPSLAQLDEAIRSFLEEYKGFTSADVIVVVDATFGHRIDPSEVPAFEQAVEHGEMVTPPAGAVGRGDGFILRIAEKAGALVLSNDSFQEFHAERPWLFDPGRLIGGKPVPGVGWIFTPRTPVRGAVSRAVTTKSKRASKASLQAGSTAGSDPASADGVSPDEQPAKPAKAAKAAKRASRSRRSGADSVAAGDHVDGGAAEEPGADEETPPVAKATKATTKATKATTKATKATTKATKATTKATKATTKATKATKAAKTADVAGDETAGHGAAGHGAGSEPVAAEVNKAATSTKATKATKAGKTAKAAKSAKTAKTAKTAKATKAAAAAAGGESSADGVADAVGGRRGEGRGGSVEALNDPLTFLTFVAEHPVKSSFEGTVTAFTSHGAHVEVDGMIGHIPLRRMDDPAPTKARQVLSKGESRTFVLVSLDAGHRRAEFALPGFAED